MITFEAYADHKGGADKQALFDEWLGKASLRNRPKIKSAVEGGAIVMINDDGGYQVRFDSSKGRVWVNYSRTGERLDFGGILAHRRFVSCQFSCGGGSTNFEKSVLDLSAVSAILSSMALIS